MSTGEPIFSDFHDAPDFAELIIAFVNGAADFRARAQAAIETEDISSLQTLAHQMKGAGGGYGFDIVSDVGRDLEAAARAGDMNRILTAHAAIDDVLSRLVSPEGPAAA